MRIRSQRGFTLVSVLAAMAILGFGLLALAKAYLSVTLTSTQNQNINSLSSLGNGFWGVVQANPSILPAVAGSYTSANIAAAPAALQPWLTEVILGAASPTGVVVAPALPSATVLVVTGPDVGTGAACSPTGCAVTVTISWLQNATPGAAAGAVGITRSQIFNYQFGL